MDPAEQALKQALESSPEDWSIRFLIVEKLQQRNALEEAAELVAASPVPPQDTQQLQKVVEIAGVGALELVRGFVTEDPSDGYGHHVLGILLDLNGETEKSEKHFNTARALGFTDASAPAPPPAAEVAEPVEDIEAALQAEDESFLHAETEAAPPPPPSPPPPSVEPMALPPINVALTEQPTTRRVASISQNYSSPGRAPAAQPKKQSGSKVTAILVAIGVHVLIGLIAAILVVLPPSKDEPEIVAAVIGPPASQREMQKKNVVKQVKKSTSASAAAAPVARLMRANAMAKFALPKVTKTSTGPLGLGEGNLGSGGFGGTGNGLGSGASFFGGSSTGERFVFILDWSGSMKPNQVNMTIREMDKTLKSLRPGVQFQVILFAGGGYYAQKGWSVSRAGGKNNTINGLGGKKYDFRSVNNSYANYDFKGSDSALPTTKWMSVSPSSIREVMSILNKKQLYGGTDWRWPIKMAMNLSPPPDVIFFMADGTGGAHPPEILRYAKSKNPRIQINMFAMETRAGASEMATISKATRGSYKIIQGNGTTIDGKK